MGHSLHLSVWLLEPLDATHTPYPGTLWARNQTTKHQGGLAAGFVSAPGQRGLTTPGSGGEHYVGSTGG